MRLNALVAALLLLVPAARAQEGPFKDSDDTASVEHIPGAADRFLMLTAAETYRLAALKTAAAKLGKLKALADTKAAAKAYPAADVKVVRSWLNVGPETSGYADTLAKALEHVDANAGAKVDHVLYPDSKDFCVKSDDGKPPAYAWTAEKRIRLCKPWLSSSDICRRVVVIHGMFHTVGLVDVDTALKFPKRTTEVALNDAAYMAGLVSELHSAHEDSCP